MTQFPAIITFCCCAVVSAPGLAAQEWTPGHHKKLPSLEEPNRTYQVYVPPQYTGEAPGLPILFMSDAGGNPNLKEYREWADRVGVLLVGIDSSRNGPSDNNIRAQNLVVKTIDEHKLAYHPSLMFATGGSGGAQASWLFAHRYGKHFAGVLMVAQGGFTDDGITLEKHIPIAWLHGKDDPIVWVVDKGEAFHKAQGNPTKRVVIPGGHVGGSVAQRVELLDWVFTTGVLNQPSLDAPTREALTAAQAERLKDLLVKGEAATCRDEAEVLLALPNIARHPHARTIAACWQDAAATVALQAEEPRQRVRAAAELAADPRMRGASKASELKAVLDEVRKDKALNAEAQAAKAWVALRHAEESSRGKAKGVRLEVAKQANAVATRYKDTLAGDDAKALFETLRVELGG